MGGLEEQEGIHKLACFMDLFSFFWCVESSWHVFSPAKLSAFSMPAFPSSAATWRQCFFSALVAHCDRMQEHMRAGSLKSPEVCPRREPEESFPFIFASALLSAIGYFVFLYDKVVLCQNHRKNHLKNHDNRMKPCGSLAKREAGRRRVPQRKSVAHLMLSKAGRVVDIRHHRKDGGSGCVKFTSILLRNYSCSRPRGLSGRRWSTPHTRHQFLLSLH